MALAPLHSAFNNPTNEPASSTVYIPGGDAGIFATEGSMAAAVRASTADPLVVNLARSIVASATPYASGTQYRAAVKLRTFLWSVWRFADDPQNRELLRTPHVMLEEYMACGVVMGDCDEAALLGAALGLSVNIQPALTVVEFADDGGGYSHVFATLLPTDGPAVSLDVTRPPRGTPVPVVARHSTQLV